MLNPHRSSGPRSSLLLLVMGSSPACTDETTGADEVGSTTDIGTTGEDSTGEDATDSTGDDSTDTGSIEPCGFEWVTRGVTLESANFTIFTPTVITEDSLIIAHQTGPTTQIDTRITSASLVDGTIQTSIPLTLTAGQDYPQSLALGPDGDLLLGSTNYFAEGAQVRRMRPDGETVWVTSASNGVFVGDVALAPSGEVVYVSSHDAGLHDSDAGIFGLDPDDGSVLWAHPLGGMADANGYSLDHGWSVVVDEQGSKFVGIQQYVDWNTTEPLIAAYPAGDVGEPLWIREPIEAPGDHVFLRDLVLGPEGLLLAVFHHENETFWVAALDTTTGEVVWMVERDELGLPGAISWSRPGGVVASAERVLVSGWWVVARDGEEVHQGFVIELDLTGQFECVGTLDDYDPELGTFEYDWLPLDVEVGPQGEFYLGGFVTPAWDPTLATELLLAKVH